MSEEKDRVDGTADETKAETKSSDHHTEDTYEKVCFMCRRPESKAGRMFKLPNHICICDDCMHKTMETVSQFDYQGMLNNPNDFNQFNGQNGFPNISFVNLADLQGDGGIPNKQKLKKKKKKPDDQPVLDIKNIPPPHKIKAQLDEFVRSLPEGLDTGIGERGIRISGGQRQRISIARALFEDPEVLIMDEATSALDNDTEAAIMDSINRLHGRKTMVIIAHRLQTIEKCDIVYRVEDGKVTRER